MYIVLMTHKDEAMMMAMKEGIKKQFPQMKFTTQEYENRGVQLRLEGTHDETKPNAFASGFASAWIMIHEAQALEAEELAKKENKK